MPAPYSEPLTGAALGQLFHEARSYNAWLERDVSEEQIHAIYELVKMGPTSANQQPARLVWCKSDEAKARLASHAGEANRPKITGAPVCVIVGMDLEFHEQLPWLFPHTDARGWFTGSAELRRANAFRNSSLQGGYLMLAARAVGLDCGPMSGFDNAKVDAEFFPEGQWKSNFLCNLGKGDPAKLPPLNPRFGFEEVCKII